MSRRFFQWSLAGTVIAAICCFTPLLAWAMALLGLSIYLGWVDAVMVPLLGVFAALTLIAYIRLRNA